MILEAADEVFAAEGIEVSMKKIATRAEVSTATLYRHFANRAALVRAVYEARIDHYRVAVVAATEIADPFDSFRQTLHAVVELQARDRFFREFVREHDDPFNDELLYEFATPLLGAIESARSAKVLRPEVAAGDIFTLLTMVESVARPLHRVSAEGLTRIVDLLLDGICTHHAPISGAEVTLEEVFHVIND